MKIAFIGLGQMGAPMARRLVDSEPVRVFDQSEEASAAFGAAAAGSLAEAGAGAEVIITMLPNGAIVREALLGDGGALANAAAGAIVVDMSSSDATGTRALAADLAKRGIVLIDAPVSGGVAGAVDGKLTIMVGADDPAAVAGVTPLLERMGSRVILVGPAGAGHAVKAINNVIAAAIIAVTSEGTVIGERFGVDPLVLLDVINSSTGRSGVSETLFKGQMLPRKFAAGFALGLMAKDVGIAEALSQAQGGATPVIDATASSWRAARDALGATEDFSSFLKYVEQQNGGRPVT